MIFAVALGSVLQEWTVGAFDADDTGHVTEGIFDVNGPPFPALASGKFTGSYSAGPGLRGELTVNVAASAGNPGGPTRSFCLALDTIAGTVDTNLAGDMTVKIPEEGKYTGGTNGRFLLTLGTATSPTDAMYVVSPKLFHLIDIDGGIWNPLIQNTHQ